MSGADAPFFSLVVPTIGRVAEVHALLASIACSESKDLEVILVDQNEDDRLVPTAKAFRDVFSLQHLRVSFRGAARARNYGARFAAGRVLNFPDDDCELIPGVLDRARAAIQERNLLVLIGMSVDRAGRPSNSRFKSGRTLLTVWNMWSRNIEFTMFFDRATFAESGGFDEDFGVGSSYGADEGPELLIRILPRVEYGVAEYDSSLRFYHPEKVVDYTAAALDRSFSYARGTGALLAKWTLLPVYLHGANLFVRALVGSIVFRGAKGQYYLRRVTGLWDGFSDYRRHKIAAQGTGA
jgi:glycosyltransferase involved in cell wall biosynthesis